MKKGSTFTGRWRISMQTISFVIIGQIKKSWIKVLEHPLLHMIMLTTPILSPLQLSVIYHRYKCYTNINTIGKVMHIYSQLFTI